MITDKIKDNILLAIQSIYQLHPKSDVIEVTQAANREHGDYATNIAFKLAKELSKSPKAIAEEIAKVLDSDGSFAKVEAVNGFVNMFLDHSYFQGVVAQILKEKEHYADLNLLRDKKIQVEFISANPTGPLTLANGRGGFSGDVLANVFTKAGAKVEREYYVNDGGNQVRILGDAILVSAGLKKAEGDIYHGEYIDNLAKKYSDKLVEYQDKPFELGVMAAKDLLDAMVKPSTKKIGINFDKWFSEKEMIDRGEVEESLAKIQEMGLTKTEEGALWFKTTEFGDDKDRVLVKSDGEKTYFANDVAYHWDKFEKRNFDKVVNFWGADHHGYVGRMQAAVTAMGFGGRLNIAIMQLVRLIKDGQEFKISKRKGNFVTVDDLLDLIGGSEKEAADVARFFFLMRSSSTHMDFDLDLAREHSDKNPVFYVKYAHARISSILRNAGELKLPKSELSLLTEPQETELIEQMAQLPQVIMSIVSFDEYPVHYLTFYAIDLAKKFHAFYDKCRVIDEENLELTAARIELVRATQIVLGIVMRDLIGIDAPEKM